MKYIQTYNEKLSDKLVPPTDEEILFKMKDKSSLEILYDSISNQYAKGVELALKDTSIIFSRYNWIYILILKMVTNKDVIKILLDNNDIKSLFSETQIYLFEKYLLGKHNYEIKNYEKYLIELLLTLEKFTNNLNNVTTYYDNNGDAIFFMKENSDYNFITLDENLVHKLSKYVYSFDDMSLLCRFIFSDYYKLDNIRINNRD